MKLGVQTTRSTRPPPLSRSRFSAPLCVEEQGRTYTHVIPTNLLSVPNFQSHARMWYDLKFDIGVFDRTLTYWGGLPSWLP